MTDCHLIVFFDNQNLGIDTKIGFLSGMAPNLLDIISYPLFADADTWIYPHAASQYHTRPKAKRRIAMLSVDKFPYPRPQTRGNEFIQCSNNICDILKRFRSFKISAITLIWPKSSYKQRVLMHGHQGWNVRHGLCHIFMIYVYIWVVYSFCLFCCLFIIVTTQFVALYKPCKPKPMVL